MIWEFVFPFLQFVAKYSIFIYLDIGALGQLSIFRPNLLFAPACFFSIPYFNPVFAGFSTEQSERVLQFWRGAV